MLSQWIRFEIQTKCKKADQSIENAYVSNLFCDIQLCFFKKKEHTLDESNALASRANQIGADVP